MQRRDWLKRVIGAAVAGKLMSLMDDTRGQWFEPVAVYSYGKADVTIISKDSIVLEWKERTPRTVHFLAIKGRTP